MHYPSIFSDKFEQVFACCNQLKSFNGMDIVLCVKSWTQVLYPQRVRYFSFLFAIFEVLDNNLKVFFKGLFLEVFFKAVFQ